MSAEGILNNPRLFCGLNPYSFIVAKDYLEFARRFKTEVGAIRAHLFHICQYRYYQYRIILLI